MPLKTAPRFTPPEATSNEIKRPAQQIRAISLTSKPVDEAGKARDRTFAIAVMATSKVQQMLIEVLVQWLNFRTSSRHRENGFAEPRDRFVDDGPTKQLHGFAIGGRCRAAWTLRDLKRDGADTPEQTRNRAKAVSVFAGWN